MKKTFSIILTIAMLCCVALAGCSNEPQTISGTYTITHAAEAIASNTFHNGYVTAMGASEVNTIEFSEDGTYIYTKELHTVAEDGTVVDPQNAAEGQLSILVTYTYYGTYTMDGGNAILSFPTKCDFSENWGTLADMGMFLNSSGSYTYENGNGSGDIVKCKEEESHNPMDIFVGPYVLDSLTTSESGFDAANCTVTVTLNQDTNTFTYVIVNTDDE